jgi:hypothetical protein
MLCRPCLQICDLKATTRITWNSDSQFHFKLKDSSELRYTEKKCCKSILSFCLLLQLIHGSKSYVTWNFGLDAGDDCISIQTGCSNINIHNVNCGPGHGISIGGLGQDNTKGCVSNVTVRDINMFRTMTGTRIKTWHVCLCSEGQIKFQSNCRIVHNNNTKG